MTSPVTVTPAARVRGFTLLEVLIAIVIFSIGLFGIAGLQASGMRFTQGSQLRLVAVSQAEAIADRMRANPAGVVEGHYNLEGETLGGEMPTAFTKDCGTNTCNREDLAIYDLVTWNGPTADDAPAESNAEALPDGAGVVCIDSTPNDAFTTDDWGCDNEGAIYAIKILWSERTVGADDLADTDGDGDNEAGDMSLKRIFVRVTPYADMAVDGIESGEAEEGGGELGGEGGDGDGGLGGEGGGGGV